MSHCSFRRNLDRLMFVRASVFIVVASCAGCSSGMKTASPSVVRARPLESLPGIGIGGTAEAGVPTFSFRSCSALTQSAEVQSLYISRIDTATSEGNGVMVCIAKSGSDEHSLGEHWQYGHDGTWVRISGCETPLTEGTYRILVSGFGEGGRAFEVHKDGTLTWLDEEC